MIDSNISKRNSYEIVVAIQQNTLRKTVKLNYIAENATALITALHYTSTMIRNAILYQVMAGRKRLNLKLNVPRFVERQRFRENPAQK